MNAHQLVKEARKLVQRVTAEKGKTTEKTTNTLYTNTKAIVTTPDGDTESFNILAGVLQGDTLAPFIFILILDYVLRISVEQKKPSTQEKQPPPCTTPNRLRFC